jgi:tyrosyl-tRNA synthetase
MLKEGGVQVNKQKVEEGFRLDGSHLLNDKYILIQKGKKNYHLIRVL